MRVIASKLKEVFFSVLPVMVLVLILHFSIAPIKTEALAAFISGSIFVVFGLTIFLLGVDLGITPLGSKTGITLAKTNNLIIVLVSGIILGFFISIAEPGLMVLAGQVDNITGGIISTLSLLILVSAGLSVMLSLGFVRIFYNVPLYKILFGLYILIFIMCLFSSEFLLAIAFDASGATTGILAVPFILSLSVGISKLKKDSKASEKDSFGLVAIASTGAIMVVLLLSVFSKNVALDKLEIINAHFQQNFIPFVNIVFECFKESLIAIVPLFVIFVVLQRLSFKLKKRELRKVKIGFIFSFIGLFLFLVGVNSGFMNIGIILGNKLAQLDNKFFLVAVSFILGVVTILAEPAVHVLTHQIEEVTSGYVKKAAVLFSLAIGVGLAVMFSIIRILVTDLKLWHFILPGYIICLGLMFIIPKLFVGIAFDAGAVATGPMTATFILAFIQGAAASFEGANLLTDGFGMIALVAMTPIITLEVLGLLFYIMSKRKEVNQNE